MSTIFISYCRSDRDGINRILSEIKSSSLEFWLDESDILPTMDFNATILDGLAKSKWFLLAMTPRSAESAYVKDELHWALTNRKGHILPVMLDQCDPARFHLRMMQIQYVNLQPDNRDGTAQLQRALQLIHKARGEESLPLPTRKMDSDLELISLLLTFISRQHQKHIANLLAPHGSVLQAYLGNRPLRHELRDLRTWGIVDTRPHVKIGELAQDGRAFILGDLVVLTDLGKRLASHVS